MRKTAITVLAVVLASPLAVMAQRHPGYMHALSDLRYARALLEHGEWGRVARDQQFAIHEIDRAVDELSRAAADDGKNLGNHPAPDVHWQPHERLPKAEEALDAARRDIDREEDNPAARAWRDRAFHHIDEARHAVHHAIETWH